MRLHANAQHAVGQSFASRRCHVSPATWPIRHMGNGRARAATSSRLASSKTIREFIASECPVAGFDGRFRERQRESTVEAALICSEEAGLLVPGCQAVLRISQEQLEQVVKDQGQVLVCVMQPGGSMLPQLPAKGGGSYASLAQAYGLQRLEDGQGGFVRVVAQQRVLVQAVQGQTRAQARAQAAVLTDRWAYFVRAQSVQAVLDAAMLAASVGGRVSQETLQLGAQPADVRSSIVSMQDVAQQVQMDLLDVREGLLTMQRRQQVAADSSRGGLRATSEAASSVGEAVDEALDELSRMVEFVHRRAADSSDDALAEAVCSGEDTLAEAAAVAPSAATRRGGGGGDVLGFSALERLSFAVCALDHLTAFVGLAPDALLKQRRSSMEASDLGLRLETALEMSAEIAARLSARLAVSEI